MLRGLSLHCGRVGNAAIFTAASHVTTSKRCLSTEEFASTGPMILVHAKLRTTQQAVLTNAAWTSLLKECHVVDIAAATGALVDAGCILAIDGGAHYHIKPAQWLHDVATASNGGDDGSGPFANLRIVQDAQEAVNKAESRHNEILKLLDGAVSKASRWRKTVWGGAMLFSGAQLAIISRLTYVDLDWDIMEPVSYFLGTGTSLVFFMYVLRYKRDHSYEDFDRTFLPARVRKYAPRDFDWGAYEASKESVITARTHLKYVKEWASVH
jgi:calcium uniporter protein, mitochondrial